MKTAIQKSAPDRGTTLFVTVGVCAILATAIGSYLCLIQSQRLSVSRAQVWDAALVLAEGGVEEAMAHLNSGVSTNNLATNTWLNRATGMVGKTNSLGSSYYDVSIKIPPAVPGPFPVIVSTAYVPSPLSGPPLSRTIQVGTKAKSGSGAGGAIIVSGTVNFSGSGVTVDSFDSSNTNYSTGGLYDSKKHLANGDVVTTSSVSNALYVGNSVIYGTAHTGPGGIVGVDTSKQATDSVGDTNWVDSGKIGIQDGHELHDASFNFDDVTVPTLAWMPPAWTKYKVNGAMYNYVLNNSSPWKLSTLSAGVYVNAPNVILYVTDTFNLGTGMGIYIAPGASLTVYCGAPLADIGGQGVVNTTGLAKNFTFYGLPTNTSVNVQANASFTGQIYAPEAYVVLGGGGSSTNDFSGQIIGQSMKMNGHFNVHYDQALNAAPTMSGYTAASWTEL